MPFYYVLCKYHNTVNEVYYKKIKKTNKKKGCAKPANKYAITLKRRKAPTTNNSPKTNHKEAATVNAHKTPQIT